jgi:integrase
VTYKRRRISVPLEATERPWAEAEMARIVEEIRRDVWIEPEPGKPKLAVPSFAQFAEQWLARQIVEGGRQRAGLTPGAEAELRWALGHLAPHFARVPLDLITIADVDDYRLAKVHDGKLAASSINKTIATLAAILERAVEYELTERNPAKGRLRRLAKPTPPRTFIDRADHIAALLEAASALDRDARDGNGARRVLLATLIFAGLRIGEALALQWADVDLVARLIRIRQAKTLAGVRAVNIVPILHRELGAYKRRQTAPDGLVFPSAAGQQLDASNVRQRTFARAVKQANIALGERGLPPLPAGLTPHSMRRTFASLLFALGEAPSYVMSQMGHTTPAFTLALNAKAMNRRDGEQAKLTALLAGHVSSPGLRGSSTTTHGSVTFRTP